MWGPNRVSYFINDGFGGFSHEKLVSNIVEPRWVYPSDLDEDGQLDVLVATLTPGTISWYPNLYCGHSTSYCEALPNSVSPIGAQIRVNGRSSISTNEMTLRAQNLRPNQFGVFFFGPLTQDPPASFGNGLRCVGTFGLSRLNPPVPTGSGTAQRVLDTTIEPLGTVSAGNTAHFQFWYRDPGTGAGFNLTDALSITFCP